jgi:drug/metabolite transporter (DMT)-like permease
MIAFSERSQDWLLASMVTAVAWGIAVILIFTANELVTGPLTVAVHGLTLLLGGFIIGIGQWLFLRPSVRRGLDWLLVCSVTWAVAMFLMLHLISFTDSAVVQVVVATLLGLSFGLAQHLTTHQTRPQAHLWLFTSGSQWGLTWFITALTLTEPLAIVTANETATIWLAGWGLLSVLTVLFLVLIFPQTFSEAAQQFSDEWLTRPKKSTQRSREAETPE